MTKTITNYDSMAKAIDICWRIDEAKEIADKSVGAIAYYKQIKDVESERKFVEIKLRAWRKIAEYFGEVITALKPEEYKIRHQPVVGISRARIIGAIKTAFPQVAGEMSESRIMEIVELSKISRENFEATMNIPGNTGSMYDFLAKTPETRARNSAIAEERERQSQEYLVSPEYKKIEKDTREIQAKQLIEQRAREAFDEDLALATDEAMKEVGVTFDRRDRRKMKQTLFLHNEELHEVMRRVSYEQDITMHEIIRRGLRLYFEQHGYVYPAEKIKEEA